MPLYTDIRELKVMLQIDPRNTEEDKNLSFYNEQASAWISEWFGRPGFFRARRTEYYSGTGTQRLLLNSRPTQSTDAEPIVVIFDPNGNFGSTSGSFDPGTRTLTYGTDYCLQIDQPDGVTSRSAILWKINSYWFKPSRRIPGYLSPSIGPDVGSYKITYTGGYTVQDLPAQLRMAADLLIARLRHLFPLGLELNSEAYEERSISWAATQKNYLMALVTPMLWSFRNWNF